MRSVKLILRESVHSLGEAGDVVSVKPGYARNFLLPEGKAILATESKVKQLEHHKRVVAEKVARELKDLRAAKDRLEKLELEVRAKAGEEGKLFGSVTIVQICELLAEKGFDIDRRRISVEETIKDVGEHRVEVRLHRDVVAQIGLTVIAEGAPATPTDAAAPPAGSDSDDAIDDGSDD